MRLKKKKKKNRVTILISSKLKSTLGPTENHYKLNDIN